VKHGKDYDKISLLTIVWDFFTGELFFDQYRYEIL